MNTQEKEVCYQPEERIRTIGKRLFETRPRDQIVLRPYKKNITQSVAKSFWSAPEHVELFKLLPEATEGQACFVGFCVSSKTEDDGYLKIVNDVDVYLDGKRIYMHGECKEEYVLLPIHVSSKKQQIYIKCYCRNHKFSFEYLLSSTVYPFMWAKDYLLHIKRTLPLEEYAEEEGIAISKLYQAECELPEELSYIFPAERPDGSKKDFAAIYPAERGYIGYAYAKVKLDGCITFYNASPIRILVNGRIAEEAQKPEMLTIFVKAGDWLLVKSCKTDSAWGFSCKDDLLASPEICSNRKSGDRWLMIGGFGKEAGFELVYGPERKLCFDQIYYNADGEKRFWRLADGSYVRPYLDSFFFGQWYYALMLGHWGIWKAARAMDEKEWQDYFIDSISILGQWFEYMTYDYEQLSVATPFLQRSLVLDHLDPLGTMGMNLAELYMITGEAKIKNTVYALRDALYEKVPRMENGIINRIETMWSDDLFMGVPFLVRLGRIFGEEKYYQDAFVQLKEYYHKLFMKDEKVFSHVFFVKDYEKSNVPWGRGNGWVLVAMSEYLEYVPDNTPNRSEVEKM